METLQPEGIKITYGYDKSSRRTLYRDALGNETTWGYDALNRTTGVTYPDQTTWTYGYDDSHNVTQIVDANGNQIAQTFDAANRLTARTVTPGTGVVGPTSESYAYDGLHRLVQAQSGTVTTSQAYDSLSRTVSETTAGQQVSYTLDDVGNRTELGYPSGHTVAQAFDPLDRPSQIGPGTAGVPTENAVSYGYRGPHLLATTGYANGIAGTRQFDAARRRTAETKVTPGNSTVFQESFSWSPRSLKTAYSRGDLNGRGFAVAYDGAKRVQQAAQHPAPTTLATNNSSLAPDALTDIPEAFSYQYDAAQNLISQTNKEDDIPVVEATPPDASGRNRPASLNGISLTWDANGNLVQRGDLALEYDFRNRLTRVSQGGVEIAQYEYDAFNRRVTKQVAGTTETTAWSGWRPIEEYRAGQIRQRRTYGLGLDEIVRLDTDLDGNGVLDSAQVPLYDETGNVAVVTDGSGQPVERYEYTPFGEKTILVDSTAPAVEQVRWVDGALVVEISEAVNGDALSRALTAGTLTLEKTATLETLAMTVDQPVETEPQAHRRVVLTLTDPTLVTATDEVRLTIPAEALEDPFLNRPSTFFELTFPWPSADTVLHDTVAPEVLEILLYDGLLQIELSEPVDLITANVAIGVGAPSLTWTASADGYTLSSVETLTDGDYTLSVGTGLQDLAGTALGDALSVDFTVAATVPKQRLFEAPNPQETTASAIGNPFGFHGLPQDGETGLVYVRNRYYDPELGRFISADPLGYVDGPSMYAFSFNSPANFSDPVGLAGGSDTVDDLMLGLGTQAKLDALRERLDAVRKELALHQTAVDFLQARRGQDETSKQEDFAAHLRDQGLVIGPEYESNRQAGRLLGPLPCDENREVICHFEGLAEPLYIVEAPVYFSTMFILPSVQAPLSARPWILMPGRGGAMVPFEEAAPLFAPRPATPRPITDATRIRPLARGSSVNVLESSGRAFVSTPKGRVVPIPEGWIAKPAQSGRGIVYQRPGASGNADMIRIMDATERYPQGYVRYYNSQKQPLDVFGKPEGRAETHIPLDYEGPIPGWPQ